jgi:hypothetical protein
VQAERPRVQLVPSVGDGIRLGCGVFLAAVVYGLLILTLALLGALVAGITLPGPQEVLRLIP